MCTLTWEKLKPSGYRLLFNRDELATRTPGLPPQVFEKNGIQAIMPIDSKAGGTWITVNSTGISVCLINNYGAEQRRHSDDAPSRGKLVMSLAYATSQQQAVEHFLQLEPKRFNPFDIFIFSRLGSPRCWSWDGVGLSEAKIYENFAFSTGFDIDAVVSNRRNLYNIWLQEKRDLADYHRSHIPRASSYSVCMHREGAGTQSMSELRVCDDEITFSYTPGPPCETTALTPIRIKGTVQ